VVSAPQQQVTPAQAIGIVQAANDVKAENVQQFNGVDATQIVHPDKIV